MKANLKSKVEVSKARPAESEKDLSPRDSEIERPELPDVDHANPRMSISVLSEDLRSEDADEVEIRQKLKTQPNSVELLFELGIELSYQA